MMELELNKENTTQYIIQILSRHQETSTWHYLCSQKSTTK